MAIPFLNNIDLVKNQLLNAVFQNLAVAPSNPVEGQFYYNTTDKKMFYYNGTAWVDTTYLLPIASATVLGGVKVGSGLAIDGNGVLSATGTDTEIINNLTSDRTDAALAAAQGKVLKGLIDTIQSTIDGLGTAATKNVGTASGNIPVLDSNGKLNTSVLPALAITEVFTVASQSAMTSLTAQQGDVAVRTDVNKTFILSQSPAATAANWIELQFPISVTSVNGKTGIITLTGEDINATVGSVTKSVQSFLADLGEIDLKVQENTTAITTIEGDIDNVETLANNAQNTADSAVEGVTNITNTQAQAEGKNIHIEDSAEEPFVDVELYGESTQNGTPTSDNLVEIENIEGKNIWNKSEISEKTSTVNMVVGELNVKDVPIPFTFSSYLISNALTDTNVRVSFMDSNNSNIGAVKFGNTVTSTNKRSSITINEIPEGAVKIKFGIRMQDGGHTEKTQLEAGTVATPYVPYNSLEFKVEGKNLFDNKWTGTISTNFIPVFAGKHYIYSESGIGSAMNYRFYSDINGNYTTTYVASGKSFIPAEDGYVKLYKTTTTKIECMLEEGTETTDYEPYKSQVVTFPLAEGQKLMEGSYLADDGIHHSRKQVEIDVTQIRAVTSYNNIDYASIPKPADFIGYNNYAYYEILCNKAISQKITSWDNTENINKISSQAEQTKFYLGFEKGTTLEQMKTALANTVIEYELAEEEVVPYTAEQQTAWNKIKALMTYKNITNITSDAYAKVTYMRDNGLDVYETKQSAEKNYTETTKKLAEQKITTDEISSKVSSLETTLENNYSTTEEMNSAITAKVNEIITELLPIKIITGVIPGSSYDDNSKTQTVMIDYPSGFNASNTIVIASMLKPVSTDCTSTYSGRVDVLLYSSGEYANKMEVLFSEAWGLDMHYKIVLMKM